MSVVGGSHLGVRLLLAPLVGERHSLKSLASAGPVFPTSLLLQQASTSWPWRQSTRGYKYRLPLLQQPAPSRPGTQYLPDLGLSGPGGGGLMASQDDYSLGTPSDAELDHAVQAILRDADLNSVTKREIRRQLEKQFGCDLSSRRAMINAAIDQHLG